MIRLFPVTTAGAGAARVLPAGGEGRIIAVFRRSFYASFEKGLICVGPPGFGPGPLHLLAPMAGIASWQSWLDVGERAVAEAGRLLVDDLCFDARSVRPWRASPPLLTSADSLARGLGRLAAEAEDARPAGLGKLIISLDGHVPADHLASDDPVLAKALPIIDALMGWAGRAEVARDAPLPSVKGVLGLGPGLTPSGDDFLAGFLVALQRLGAPHLADRLASSVLPLAATETNAISAAYLACAAKGEAAASLIDAFTEISDGGADLRPHFERIAEIGHSSGWDCLAGMAFAARAMLPALVCRDQSVAEAFGRYAGAL
ncbi:DUF2877 domain-containing protein [Afifella aestuarii]|uniref:oxamate carbamoyltransferase subunit AllH family protein n=1 Tax=Afifella aestuarii TaxID=1909496 RepID=UPI000FE3C522|nr:DUF2877 domain-containing protein [Afifella aestuarii]